MKRARNGKRANGRCISDLLFYLNRRIINKENARFFPRNENAMDNHTIAAKLTEYANYQEARESSVYRVRAYRLAAQTVLGLDRR